MLSFTEWLSESKALEKPFQKILQQKEVSEVLRRKSISQEKMIQILRKIEKRFDCKLDDVTEPDESRWWWRKKENIKKRYANDSRVSHIGGDPFSGRGLTFLFTRNIFLTIGTGYMNLGISRGLDYSWGKKPDEISKISLTFSQLDKTSLEREKEILEHAVEISRLIEEMRISERKGICNWLSHRSTWWNKPTQKDEYNTDSGEFAFGRLTIRISKKKTSLFIKGISDKELNAIDASVPRILHKIRGRIMASMTGIG